MNDTWIIQEFFFDIPNSIQQFLKTLQAVECPQRLKSAKQTSMMFAAKVNEEDEIISCNTSQIFSYLPTQVRCGFPFVVNGDFLLNADRARLIDNQWNAFLFGLIGYYQLKFLANLSPRFNSATTIQTFKLLPEKVTFNAIIAIEKSYQEGLAKAIQEVAFVPSLREPHRLVKVPEVIIDSTGFFQGFSNLSFKDGTLVINSAIVRSHFMPLFQKHIKKQINYMDLWGMLEGFIGRHPDLETQQYLLAFLKKLFEQKTLDILSIEMSLKNKKMILSDQYQLCCPQDLYLMTKAVEEVPGVEQLVLVLPELSEYSETLKKIGVRKASRLEFIRRFIKADILEGKISAATVVPISRLIFDAMQSRELEEKDWEYLRKFPVKTKRGSLKLGSECYLSDTYYPTLPLEANLPVTDIFVTMEYFVSQKDITLWKQFFIKLGVKEDIKIQHEYRIERKVLEKKRYAQDYLKQLSMQGHSHLASHDICNFIDVDLLEYASMPDFSPVFWEILLSNWAQLKRWGKSSYQTNKYSYEIKLSYLQFCIRQYVLVASNLNTYLPVNQLFMPALLPYVGEALPVAKMNVSMTEEQADFFGFKSKLTVKDCLEILEYINIKEVKKDLKRYTVILKYLLEMELTENDKVELKKWSGLLLSQSNTLQPVKNLQYFFHPHFNAPIDPNWLKVLPAFSSNEMVKIAELFGIPVMGMDSIEVLTQEKNQHYSEIARTHVLEKLPIMALMIAHEHNEEPAEVLGTLKLKIEKLTFSSVEVLQVRVGKSVTSPSAYLQDNILYFENEYTHTLTKNAFCKMMVNYLKLTHIAADTLETYLYLNNLQDLKVFLDRMQLDISLLPTTPRYKLNLARPTIPSASANVLIPRVDRMDNTATSDIPPFIASFDKPGLVERLQGVQEQLNVAAIKFSKADFDVKPMTNVVADIENRPKHKQQKIWSENEITLDGFSSERLHSSLFSETEDIEHVNPLSTGRKGESIVYEKLKVHYRAKYPDCHYQETIQGFKLTGQYVNKKTNRIEPLSLELIWPNKGLPADTDNSVGSDFTLCKNGITRHIEVKASNTAKKGIFSITAREWKLMETMQNLYRIFLVKNVSAHPSIEKIKNPFALIQQGKIEIKSYRDVHEITSAFSNK